MTDLNPKFEQFMREEYAENHAEGVLDDDMSDGFEAWMGDLDSEELDLYAKKFNQTNK